VNDEDEAEWPALSDAQRAAQARSTGVGDHRGIGAHPEPFRWFQRIVALARQHGIHIVAVQYPSHAAYIQAIPPAADTLVNAELARTGITDVIDLRNVFSDPHLFKDEDHVSRRGAIRLLQILSERTGRQLLADTARTSAPPPGLARHTAADM